MLPKAIDNHRFGIRNKYALNPLRIKLIKTGRPAEPTSADLELRASCIDM